VTRHSESGERESGMSALLSQFISGNFDMEEEEEPVDEELLPNEPSKDSSAEDIMRELIKGNKRFLKGASFRKKTELPPVELMLQEPLKPIKHQAVVLSCAHLPVSVDDIFDVEAGVLQNIRVLGIVCGDHDGIMSSVDYSLSKEDAPPVLVVLGNAQSEPLKAAMEVAMEEQALEQKLASRLDIPSQEHELKLLQQLMPACQDALSQMPEASFEELIEAAARLNVWHTIETLMSSSQTVFSRVTAGTLSIYGACLDGSSGAVQVLGQHPTTAQLLEVPPDEDKVRTATSASVPAEEAFASLVAGNRRFKSRRSRTSGAQVNDFLLRQLGEGGQRPKAVILGPADSRVPLELIFDKRPGDLFVLRTAGNIIRRGKGALLGSAEFALSALHTKLIVVVGHTNCGAVTEAVKIVRSHGHDLDGLPGSLGELLADLIEAAREAVTQLPNSSLNEQVQLATKLNVNHAMKRLIKNSNIVSRGVRTMDVAIHGAVYDIFSGSVTWLGQHPDLESIVGAPMPVYRWKGAPYTRTMMPMGKAAERVIQKLQAGNANFADGTTKQFQGLSKADTPPLALVISGTEIKLHAHEVFGTAPGELVMQRCLGNIVGAQGGSLFNSLEYVVERYAPPVLMVLGCTNDIVVQNAVKQGLGSEVPPAGMRPVLDQVGVSAVRALDEVSGRGETKAGAEMKVMHVAVDLNVLYAMEQLILNSNIIRQAMRNGLEVHGAVLDHQTGLVDFLGPHPLAQDLLDLGSQRFEDQAAHDDHT